MAANGSKRGWSDGGIRSTCRASRPKRNFSASRCRSGIYPIVLRAFVRWPARIRSLGLRADHPYDLIVVSTQTWLVGMGAPMEAVFQHPEHRGIFERQGRHCGQRLSRCLAPQSGHAGALARTCRGQCRWRSGLFYRLGAVSLCFPCGFT